MTDNKQLTTPQNNTAISLQHSKNLLGLTQKLLAKRNTALSVTPQTTTVSVVDDDSWLEEIWAWADEFGLSDKEVPRDKERLLALTKLRFTIGDISYLPNTIGQLGNLQGLWVSDNQLSQLPDTIGQLGNLQTLIFYDNQLTQLPDSIGQLGNLQGLYVSHNQLTQLPDSIGQLGNLQVLGVNGNQLTHLPDRIGHLSNLQVLCAGNNQLSQLPNSILQLKQLQRFSYAGNPFTQLSSDIQAFLDRFDQDNAGWLKE